MYISLPHRRALAFNIKQTSTGSTTIGDSRSCRLGTLSASPFQIPKNEFHLSGKNLILINMLMWTSIGLVCPLRNTSRLMIWDL